MKKLIVFVAVILIMAPCVFAAVKEAAKDYGVLLDTITRVEVRVELSGGAEQGTQPAAPVAQHGIEFVEGLIFGLQLGKGDFHFPGQFLKFLFCFG